MNLGVEPRTPDSFPKPVSCVCQIGDEFAKQNLRGISPHESLASHLLDGNDPCQCPASRFVAQLLLSPSSLNQMKILPPSLALERVHHARIDGTVLVCVVLSLWS